MHIDIYACGHILLTNKYIQTALFYNTTKLEIKNKNIVKMKVIATNLKHTFVNSSWVKEVITIEIIKYLDLNDTISIDNL